MNNREASMTAVQHLLDIGHRRAGIATGELSDTAANGRYLGYCDALTERGLKVDPQFVVSGHWTMLGGTDATRRLMLLAETAKGHLLGQLCDGAWRVTLFEGHKDSDT